MDPNPDPKYMALVNISSEEGKGKINGPVGCPVCNKLGFKGRRGIYEMMSMNSEIRELAFRQEPIAKIRHAAIANGMRSLMEDGKKKVLKGLTTPAEIAAVAQVEGIE